MIKFIWFIPIALFFNSCMPSGLKYSAESVANFWQANDYSVSDSGESENKTLVLKFEEFPGVRANFPLNSIADITAVKFIDNVSEADCEDYKFIKVSVISNGRTFEKKYQFSEIVLAQKFIKISQSFFMKLNNSDYSAIDNLFDNEKFPETEKANIKNMFQKIDSLEGKCTSISFVNFELKTVDADKKPVIIINTDISYKNSFAEYMLVFRIKDEKIIHLGVNEKPKK